METSRSAAGVPARTITHAYSLLDFHRSGEHYGIRNDAFIATLYEYTDR